MEAYTPAAFEELFRIHFKYLCVVAYQHLNDQDLAQDIVQEFYIQFWEKRESIQINTNFRAYASRAIRNRSINQIRKQQRTAIHTSEIQDEENYDPQSEAEQTSQEQQRQLKLLEMVENLPEQRRQILILHALEQLSYKEIANRQNISVNTVKTQLSRAYTTLRTLTISLFIIIIYFLFS